MPDSCALMYWLDGQDSNPAVTISVSLTESSIVTSRFTFGFASSAIGHGTAIGTVWNAFVPAGAGLIAMVWFAGTSVSGTLQSSVALPGSLSLSIATSEGTTVIQTLPAGSTDPVSFTWTEASA